MDVLVTGAGGFVGGVLVDRLVADGHRVTALVRRPRTFPAGVEVVTADLCDAAALAAAGIDRGFGGVCHLAARTRVRDSRTDPLGYFAVNVEGTARLLEALVRGGGTPAVVLASTCAVYGEGTDPADESRPPAPATPYALTKYAAEGLLAAVAATGAIGGVSLRSFNVAGPGDRDLTRLVPRAVAAAAGLVPPLQVNGDGSAVREYLHVADAADAYVRALAYARPGHHEVFNVGSGVGTTVAEVIAAVEDVSGRAVPREARPPAAEPARLVADSRRARAELGWQPERPTIREIVADAWEHVVGPPAAAV